MRGEAGHVVILASYAPSLINFRGALLAELVRRGWRVTAVAPDIDADLAEALARIGVTAQPIDLVRTGMNPFADLVYCGAVRALLKRLQPDVLLAYTAKPVIWGAIAARLAGVGRTVAMITGLGYAFTPPDRPDLKYGLISRAASLMYRVGLALCDRVLFQNPDDRALFIDRGLVDPARTAVTAGSGIDLDHYPPAAPAATMSFLMAGRLAGAKGVRQYAAAAARLKRRYPQTMFRLAGLIDPGPDAVTQQELDGWIAEGVTFLGFLGDMRPSLAETAVYVLPSYREGTPRSVLEALATGRAVITTDAPGCRETVQDGVNGYLVQPRDVHTLVEAMERFILDPDLAVSMGARSLDLARNKYDVRRVNDQVIAALSAAEAVTGGGTAR